MAFGIGGDKKLGLKHFLDICEKYNKSEKLQIDAYFGSMDGRKLVDVDNYTLFESDGNTAKDHNNSSIRSFDINKLIDFTKKYHISDISNLIIYGDAKTAKVDWRLTNIIFEGDMSNLTNGLNESLTGIVYFKGLPYDNKDLNDGNGQSVDGAVRLDTLGTTNVKIKLNTNMYSVVDMRDIDEYKILNYNKSENRSIIAYAGSVYFNENIKKFADDRSLYEKLFNLGKGGRYNNEYFGNIRRDFEDSDGSPASKTPRELEEFEYYGNNHQFETSARDTYDDEAFKKLSENQQNDLNCDKDMEVNRIAKVTALCPLC